MVSLLGFTFPACTSVGTKSIDRGPAKAGVVYYVDENGDD